MTFLPQSYFCFFIFIIWKIFTVDKVLNHIRFLYLIHLKEVFAHQPSMDGYVYGVFCLFILLHSMCCAYLGLALKLTLIRGSSRDWPAFTMASLDTAASPLPWISSTAICCYQKKIIQTQSLTPTDCIKTFIYFFFKSHL